MNGRERVRAVIRGEKADRVPIYGWISGDIAAEAAKKYGSFAEFERKYNFDLTHVFGGPYAFRTEVLDDIRRENGELTPDLIVNADIFTSPCHSEDYEGIRAAIDACHREGRFAYIQTPGLFEQFNGVFGIENQLLYLIEYKDEIKELYSRQTEWTLRFADKCIELGADMIHISDDWGSQKDLLFSPALWWELIYPNMKTIADHVHSKGAFVSLHSDGCILKVCDGIEKIGFDVVHPWQERANMPYREYTEKYKESFAVLGGICVQYAIGIMSREELEEEIRRVFSLLKGKRFICCTTHFAEHPCTLEELEFAYGLINELAPYDN